jgi:hypothetical protein
LARKQGGENLKKIYKGTVEGKQGDASHISKAGVQDFEPLHCLIRVNPVRKEGAFTLNSGAF